MRFRKYRGDGVHSLFDKIVYDLDKRQIADFTMKSWVEPFLILRAAFYFDALSERMKNRFKSGLMASSNGLFHDPNGLWNPTRTLFEYCYLACA